LKNGIKTIGMWLIIAVIFILLLSSILNNPQNKIDYSDLLSKIQTGDVQSVEIQTDGKTAYVQLKDDKKQKQAIIPDLNSFMNSVKDQMTSGELVVTEKPQSFLVTLLSFITPVALVVILLLFLFLFLNPNQGGNKSMSFGKSKARMLNVTDKYKVTFKDVARRG